MNNISGWFWRDSPAFQFVVHANAGGTGRRAVNICVTSGLIAALAIGIPAGARAAVVSACSGVSLPKSDVTDIVGAALNPFTSVLDPLNLGILTSTLSGIATGSPITLNAIDTSGAVLSPGSTCNTVSDSYGLNTTQGISIGGNQITGLGDGVTASAGEINSIAFGNGATTDVAATNAIAIGPGASVAASGSNSVALGSGANASAGNSVALGAGSVADVGAQTGYTAFGLSALQSSAGEISVGAAGSERQITNVAAGSAATDAVNVAQLQGAIAGTASQIQRATADSVVYDSSAHAGVTLGGVGATTSVTVSNVAAGTLNSSSTDAVNGSQLYATNRNVSTNTTAIANLQGQAADSVSYDSSTHTSVTLGGMGSTAPVTITDVASGALTASSTDAVNGSQLYATNQAVTAASGKTDSVGSSVAAALGGQSAYDATTGTVSAPAYTIHGATVNDVGSALAALQNDAPVQYSTTTAPTAGLGATGTPITNDVTLVGPIADMPVTLHNVARGALNATSTDAVNGSQLYRTNQRLTADTADIADLQEQFADTVSYDSPTHTSVTLGGTGSNTPVTLTNVAAATLSASSTDAVNGSQLYATDQAVAAANGKGDGLGEGVAADLGGGTTYDATTGTVTAPAYRVYGAMVDDVGTAFAALQNNAPVQYSTASAPTTGLGSTGIPITNDVTLLGPIAGVPVTLHNVASGTLNAASTDAVNGGQLYATNEALAAATAAIAGISGDVGILYFHANSSLPDAIANGLDSVAIGGNALAVAANAVALGTNSVASRPNTVSVGAPGAERQITNVAPGTADTDAVDVAQLKAARLVNTNGSTNAAVTYDVNPDGTMNFSSVSLGGTGSGAAGSGSGTTIHNVAAGTATTDAVNVGQLDAAISGIDRTSASTPNPMFAADGAATEAASASATHAVAAGANATASAADAIAMGSSATSSSTNSVAVGASATASSSNAIAVGANATASSTNSIAIGANAKASSSNAVALGANAEADRANTVSVGSAGNERQITNVAAGAQGTDAVNVDQLDAAQLQQAAYTDQRIGAVQSQIDQVSRNAYAGVAAAMAMPNLAPSGPGRTVVAAGAGAYMGESAVGVGVTYRSENGKWLANGALSVTSTGYTGVRAQVGYEF